MSDDTTDGLMRSIDMSTSILLRMLQAGDVEQAVSFIERWRGLVTEARFKIATGE